MLSKKYLLLHYTTTIHYTSTFHSFANKLFPIILQWRPYTPNSFKEENTFSQIICTCASNRLRSHDFKLIYVSSAAYSLLLLLGIRYENDLVMVMLVGLRRRHNPTKERHSWQQKKLGNNNHADKKKVEQ